MLSYLCLIATKWSRYDYLPFKEEKLHFQHLMSGRVRPQPRPIGCTLCYSVLCTMLPPHCATAEGRDHFKHSEVLWKHTVSSLWFLIKMSFYLYKFTAFSPVINCLNAWLIYRNTQTYTFHIIFFSGNGSIPKFYILLEFRERENKGTWNTSTFGISLCVCLP